MNAPPPEPHQPHKKFNRDKPVRRIDFILLAEHAMLPTNMARCLAAMGFDELSSPIVRGETDDFRAEYQKFTPWRRRIGETDTEAGKGFRARAWSEEAAADADADDARQREAVARMNRWAAALECRLAKSSVRGLAVYVCTTTGEWREQTGGALGPDLVSLGALMWQVSIAEAAWRCAKVCGLRSLPLVK